MFIVVEIFLFVDAALIHVHVDDNPCERNPRLCRPHGRCESSSEADEGYYHCVCDDGWSEKDCSKGMQFLRGNILGSLGTLSSFKRFSV